MALTKFDVFQRLWKHFIVDRNPPGYDNAQQVCVYSKCCAAGIFLPPDIRTRLDETLDQETDELIGMSIGLAIGTHPKVAKLLQIEGIVHLVDLQDFWRKIQSAHDKYANSPHFHTQFSRELKILMQKHLSRPERLQIIGGQPNG